MRNFLLLIFSTVILFGCDESEGSSNIPVLNTSAIKETSLQDVVKEKLTFGSFTKNSSEMPIIDTYAVWQETEKKLKIYLTPSKMSEEEKSRLESGESDFFIFATKDSPDKEKWDWYPYVVTEIVFKTPVIDSQMIKYFYIKAYGIEEPNFTDNLNSVPNENGKFEFLKFENGVLTIRFSGQSTILENKYFWDISI